jgi:hypothetical protein
MSTNDAVENEQFLTTIPDTANRSLDIPKAQPVHLQTFDVARHIAVAPDGKRYVVATVDDTRLRRGYNISVYPQQNGYLTLIRLGICTFSRETLDEALQLHITLVQAIQEGRLQEFAQRRT